MRINLASGHMHEAVKAWIRGRDVLHRHPGPRSAGVARTATWHQI